MKNLKIILMLSLTIALNVSCISTKAFNSKYSDISDKISNINSNIDVNKIKDSIYLKNIRDAVYKLEIKKSDTSSELNASYLKDIRDNITIISDNYKKFETLLKPQNIPVNADTSVINNQVQNGILNVKNNDGNLNPLNGLVLIKSTDLINIINDFSESSKDLTQTNKELLISNKNLSKYLNDYIAQKKKEEALAKSTEILQNHMMPYYIIFGILLLIAIIRIFYRKIKFNILRHKVIDKKNQTS